MPAIAAIAAAQPAVAQDDRSPEQIREGIEAKPWFDFYQLAAALHARGEREEAARWLYIGQMRGRAHILCHAGDPTGAPALLGSLNQAVGQPINEWLYGSVSRAVRVIDAALEWEAANPDPALPSPKCDDALAKVRADKREQRAYSLANADAIRKQRAQNGLPNEGD